AVLRAALGGFDSRRYHTRLPRINIAMFIVQPTGRRIITAYMSHINLQWFIWWAVQGTLCLSILLEGRQLRATSPCSSRTSTPSRARMGCLLGATGTGNY